MTGPSEEDEIRRNLEEQLRRMNRRGRNGGRFAEGEAAEAALRRVKEVADFAKEPPLRLTDAELHKLFTFPGTGARFSRIYRKHKIRGDEIEHAFVAADRVERVLKKKAAELG